MSNATTTPDQNADPKDSGTPTPDCCTAPPDPDPGPIKG